MKSIMHFVLFSFFFYASFCSQEFPRPLILEYPDGGVNQQQLYLQCTSWRVAVEANNLNPWKTVPYECGDYVKTYITGGTYKLDLERVSNEASVFAKSVGVEKDGNDAWVFDIDETLLSNLPYYADHGYGLEVFNGVEFDKWVAKAMAPAIESSLRLYEEVLSLGFKVFLLTGRSENLRDATVQNLLNVGFKSWDKLILRGAEDHGKTAMIYKWEKRNEMVKEGFRIIANSGDQWSDLLPMPMPMPMPTPSSMSTRSFKLPNPMYYIP